MSSAAAHRILDASLNRAGEGLRVVEDYVRFALDDAHLTGHVKQLRHDLATAGRALSLSDRHAVRDTPGDVGTAITTPSESHRASDWDVCVASLERVKQSLRSLEEFSKVLSPSGTAAEFESLRYRLYTLEAAIGRTMDALERLDDVRLYVLIDGCESEAEFARRIDQLLRAGVDAIQLRDKRLSDRDLIRRSHILHDSISRHAQTYDRSGSLPLVGRAGERVGSGNNLPTPRPSNLHQPRGTRESVLPLRPLVILNDRPDIAAVHADGVHLGQEDMSVKDARAILGPQKLIGVSTHSIEQAREAVLAGASYIGVGPTFPSLTKEFASFPGLALLRQVAAEIRLPAFAIGGIDHQNAADVLAAGFTRIAVSSAVTNALEPRAAAAELRAVLAQ